MTLRTRTSGATSPAQPVFTLGVSRSGTTLLANTLAREFALAAPAHRLHYGVKEAAPYRAGRYWGPLSNLDRLIEFAETNARTDFYQLAGCTAERIYALRPKSVYELFPHIMNDYAAREGLGAWTAKLDMGFLTDTAELQHFLSAVTAVCGPAKYVAIRRPYAQVLASTMHQPGTKAARVDTRRARLRAWGLSTVRYHGVGPAIERFVREQGGVVVEYEALVEEPTRVTENLGAYLGLPRAEDLIGEAPIANSSFQSGSRNRPHPLSVQLGQALGRCERLNLAAARAVERRGVARMPASWQLLKEREFPSELKAELMASGNVALASLVDSNRD